MSVGPIWCPKHHLYTDEGDLCPLCVAEENDDLRAEIERLKAGRFTEEEFQNLCHGFSADDACRFRKGCEEYQQKLFGPKKE